ncbi:helix-turn-helix domain-containing protein [Aureivirga marina]|uniref:helix-turn-helix domain-containing protein n=1 Tax=Aureivirga marina TaxID=1182451 RepID=UPI001E3574DD|nr:response regulator transcription factor [Aureivirga marina]
METVKINSISKLHEFFSYPHKPTHPLITLIDFSEIDLNAMESGTRKVFNFYSIVLKKLKGAGVIYGRKDYDFSEASLLCMAPDQLSVVTDIEKNAFSEGWGLYFHPDLIRSSLLHNKIKKYSFFSYNINEALHLSENEKNTLFSIVQTIQKEFSDKLDPFSHDLIISNIEVLLNYCNRFYGRQFLTRNHHNKGIVVQFEEILTSYFESKEVKTNGLLTVKYCANQLHLSPNYLGDLLKQETGKSAMDHIHYFLIEKAKTLLLNSPESISEIAYSLGFEQRQSFSRLFKNKTGMSPKEYANNKN